MEFHDYLIWGAIIVLALRYGIPLALKMLGLEVTKKPRDGGGQ